MNLRVCLLALCVPFLVGACATTTVQPVTTEEVVAMTKAGAPPEAIIQRLRESGTVYQLSASDIVRLHEQGVPPIVLNYMQQTYLDAVRLDEARRAYLHGPYPFGWPYHRFPWWL